MTIGRPAKTNSCEIALLHLIFKDLLIQLYQLAKALVNKNIVKCSTFHHESCVHAYGCACVCIEIGSVS